MSDSWNKMVEKDKKRYNEIIFELTSMKRKQKDIKKLAGELFDLGFKEGQHYVWETRNGSFIEHEDKKEDKQFTWTVTTNVDGQTFTYESGKLIS